MQKWDFSLQLCPFLFYNKHPNQQKVDLNVKNNERMDYITEIGWSTWLPNINQIDAKDKEKF
ncbi:hypothetical protein QTP99_02140 [Caldanaerobacter subterraneus KAk]|uniref:hypothetical protein n=1 Tax=Caldanaerobacter subterraneus TaxID=911092 RepID=UPI0032C16638